MTSTKKLSLYFPFITVSAAVIITASIGSIFTLSGIEWYNTIAKPSWTPSGNLIGIAWIVIYTLTTASALLTWHSKMPTPRLRITLFLFLINAILNVLWTFIFFNLHEISWALAEMVILNITTVLLISLIWPFSRLGAILLVPYVTWVSFAIYLTYIVLTMN